MSYSARARVIAAGAAEVYFTIIFRFVRRDIGGWTGGRARAAYSPPTLPPDRVATAAAALARPYIINTRR